MKTTLAYQPNEYFDRFLQALQQQEPREWAWLISEFRKRLVPFLRKRTTTYPQAALLSKDQFIEEVIEETLLQFYQLFQKGSFTKYSDLEATVITTAGYKVKEGFARLKKEQKLYFMEAETLSVLREKQHQQNEQIAAQEAEQIAKIKTQLHQLESGEKDLLMRYFNGEELQDIAEDLSISPAACRKRKQRLVDKLKTLVLKAFTLFILLFI